jgi:VNT family MFS transporter (synaptic vesicle glycoprotein 2)
MFAGIGVVIENKEHFSAWHQFLLVCSLPSLAAIIGLIFLPESPRYLLEAGREVEAMMVYQVTASESVNKSLLLAYFQTCSFQFPSQDLLS